MIFEQVFVNRVITLDAYSDFSREDSICSPNMSIWFRQADFGLRLMYASRQLHTETALLPYKLCTMRLLGRWWIAGVDESRFLVRYLVKRRLKKQVEVIRDLALEVWDEQDRKYKYVHGTGSYWLEWLDSEEDGQWLNEFIGFKK